MSINNVTIGGNLAQDVELKRTGSGMAVLNFTVAVNDRRKNPKTDEWEDYASFVDCVTFGRRAEALAGIFTKGMRVCVSGKLNQQRWESTTGKHSKLQVIANDIDFMSPKQAKKQDKPQPSKDDYEGYDPSIPF